MSHSVGEPKRVRAGGGRGIAALLLREMSTTHGRSPGGYLWAVIEPLAAIALLSYAFSLVLRAPALGESFALFYASGYLPYVLFHDLTNKVAGAVRFSRPLLSFSAVTIFDTIVARALLNTLTHLLVIALVLGTLLSLDDAVLSVAVGPLANGLSMAAALGLGAGTLNCYLFETFPAWERVWMVITRPLFIVSGVFFLYEDVPSEFAGLLWFNPVFHATGEVRAGLYPGYDATYVSPAFVYGIALVLLAAGLLLIHRHSDALIHK